MKVVALVALGAAVFVVVSGKHWNEFLMSSESRHYVDFHFFIVSDRGICQLPGTLFGMKKYCSLPKLSHFEFLKIHTITLRLQNLMAIPRKSTFKSNLSLALINWLLCLRDQK